MKTLKLCFCVCAGLWISTSVGADPIVVHGQDMTYTHPGFKEKIEKIWHFASHTLAQLPDSVDVAPEIYLEPFDRSKETPDLVSWQNSWIVNHADVWSEWMTINGVDKKQITPDWVQAHLAEIFPFPLTFRGFHYEQTNRLQINPASTFMAFYQNDPYGNAQDLVGYGYYVLGHEMTHFALATRKVPETLHHCIYVTKVGDHKSLMARMAEYLQSVSIAGSMVEFYGLNQEISLDPCAQLSAADQATAKAYATSLATGGVPVEILNDLAKPLLF